MSLETTASKQGKEESPYPWDPDIIKILPGNTVIRKSNQQKDPRVGKCPKADKCEWYSSTDRDCNHNRKYINSIDITEKCYHPK